MKKDMETGKIAEDELVEYLQETGFIASINCDYSLRYDYDVIATNQVSQYEPRPNLTFEVKNDVMSAKTGNVAIEFWNSKQNKPSGLYITKADFWVHKFSGKLWICPVLTLKNFTKTEKPDKIVIGGGDANADLLIFKIERVKDVFIALDSITSSAKFYELCPKQDSDSATEYDTNSD